MAIEPVAKVTRRSGARTQIAWANAGIGTRVARIARSRIARIRIADTWPCRSRIDGCLPCSRPRLELPVSSSGSVWLHSWRLEAALSSARSAGASRCTLVRAASPAAGRAQGNTQHGNDRSQSRAAQPFRIVCPGHLCLTISSFVVLVVGQEFPRQSPLLSVVLESASIWLNTWALLSKFCKSFTTAACPAGATGLSRLVMPR